MKFNNFDLAVSRNVVLLFDFCESLGFDLSFQ